MKTQRFDKKTKDGAIPLVISAADGDGLPGLLIVPSIFGIGDDLVSQMEELAAHSIVVAMDPFWRVQPGPLSYADARSGLERAHALDMAACYRDVGEILRWTKNHPRSNGHVAILGICFGGPFALMAAADARVDGVATWHGSRMQHFVERSAEMQCPMTHHFGAEDRVVPIEAIDAVRAAFAGRDDVTITVHEGAGHGFTHRGNAHYDESAERAAMADVTALLAHVALAQP